MILVEMVGPAIMKKIMEMFAPQLQGMTANLQGLSSDTQEQTIDHTGMTDQEKIDKAFEILSKLINADQFLEFALILEQKPHLVKMLPALKNF